MSKCPNCGKQVGNNESICHNCAYVLDRNISRLVWFVFMALFIILIVFLSVNNENVSIITGLSYQFFIILILVLLYFVPTILAFVSGRKNATAIFVLNLLLGWTFAGWVVALVWSLCKDK